MIKDKTLYQILIVEDNEGDFILVVDYLKEQIETPSITHVKNFKDAASLIASNKIKFDVVLLDLTLPDKSGKALITKILEITSGCPVIVLTGYKDIDFSKHSISLGISDYLLKADLNGTSLYKSIIYCIERKKCLLEIEKSEKQYSDLFHLNPQPMWVYDMDTLAFLDVNIEAIKHYGYSKKEFLSMSIRDISAVDDIPILDKIIKTFKSNLQLPEIKTYKNYKKNGNIIDVEIRGDVINFKGKKAFLIVANDITVRIEYIETIETQNKKLEEIAWMQSHLVRAPLARIMGIVDLIQNHSKENNSESKDLFNHLLNSANELDLMIKDISYKTHILKPTLKSK